MNFRVPSNALVIDTPFIDRILRGEKTWEMRSRNCSIRGTIGLIRKGSGCVVGLADIVGVKGPFTPEEMLAHQDKHRISSERLADPNVAKWNRAWVLENVRVLNEPVPYHHRLGAQTWVVLNEEARTGIAAQIQTAPKGQP